MIGYNCKYSPIELLNTFDKAVLFNNDADQFDYSQSVMHPNICSHIKSILEDVNTNNYDKIFLMNCCDSTRRLNDVLNTINLSYIKSLDLPIDDGNCAIQRLKNEFLQLISELEKQYKIPFDKTTFLNNFEDEKVEYPNGKFVLILGARSSISLLNASKSCFDIPVIDQTCTNNRYVSKYDMRSDDTLDTLMEKYAHSILKQTPCMRMSNIQSRKQLINNENCVGIIYHTIKFCDYYDYEYSEIKKHDIPIIKIETDYTKQSASQISTRIEGFAESLKGNTKKPMTKNESGKYFVGIDSGSTSTELVAIDNNNNIIKQIMVRTGSNAGIGAKKALTQSKINLDDIVAIVATGYGRKNIDFANDAVTEITCHAKGATHQLKDVRTIIDIGGQDSKVISLDQEGNITNFVMNDKCAAGTGRFLENMAKVLEIDIDKMATIGQKYKKDITISSMCTVFAESEVVSLIAENNSVSDIVHGLNKSVAVKTKSLARRASNTNKIMMTGGVAKNQGVVKELEKQLNTKIFIPQNPEFCGALGAALIAKDNI